MFPLFNIHVYYDQLRLSFDCCLGILHLTFNANSQISSVQPSNSSISDGLYHRVFLKLDQSFGLISVDGQTERFSLSTSHGSSAHSDSDSGFEGGTSRPSRHTEFPRADNSHQKSRSEFPPANSHRDFHPGFPRLDSQHQSYSDLSRAHSHDESNSRLPHIGAAVDIYLGGIDHRQFDPNQIAPQFVTSPGYVGCVRDVILSEQRVDLIALRRQQEAEGITQGCREAEAQCHHHPCRHEGVCRDRWTGHMCDCSRTGYRGPTCDESTS